ncbi:MAG: hypothetical protein ACI4O3_04125 [Oscillospiraceae bacterium]
MKKVLALILALAMALALVACGDKDSGQADPSPDTVPDAVKGDPAAEDVLLEIVHDGDATKITNAAFDHYFGGNALEGVKTLLDEGKIYVNGIKVPATADETIDYQVNGVSSLYKTNSGWGYNVHKTTSADNLSFEEARLGFYETITTVRGHVTTLYGDSTTGLINKIDSQSYDVVRVTETVFYNESITVVRGNFDLETNRVRPDVNNIVFHSSKYDNNIATGDFALYYYGPEGWIIEKADSLTGTLSKNANGWFVINAGQSDEYACIESNVSRYNLINSNRPTQFYTAYVNLGLTEVPVVMWCTPTGHPIGFTYGDKATAKGVLALAIENAKAAKENVVVSVDGSDVAKGTMWVAQADLDAYDAAIAEAQAVCNRNSTAVQEYDAAIYALANALGETGEKPTGFLGAQGEGTK